MPLPERTCVRIIPPGERHGEPWANGSGAYVGEGERGIIPPDRPAMPTVRARIAWHAVLAAAQAWGLYWYGGSLRLAEAVGVQQEHIHVLCVMGPGDDEITALLSGVERLERGARIAQLDKTFYPRALLGGGTRC